MAYLRIAIVFALVGATTTSHALAQSQKSEGKIADVGRMAYKLNWSIDGPLLAIATPIAASWLLHSELGPASCAPLCSKQSLWQIDQWAAGLWNHDIATMSHIGVATVSIGAAAMLLWEEDDWLSALNDAVVVIESGLTALAISSITNFVYRRPRPLLFSQDAPVEDRMSGWASLSFASGHTALSFAVVWSTLLTVERLGSTKVSWPWLALGFLLASGVGAARILSGEHFPTDVLAGAAIGTFVGITVPMLHSSAGRLSASADRNGAMVAWVQRW